MNLKERYARFRAWQQNPFRYEFTSHEQHHCANCDHDFTGNFCPYCSQKAGTGAVSWSSVRQGIGEIWGMGNRSMTYSMWQLLWRPGYFIGDYISGRRQVSFPPVKMLLIVAIIISLIDQMADPEGYTPRHTDREYDFITMFINWIQANMGWGLLACNSFIIIPTWLLFRYSPRHSHHSLPASFFLQVFMAVITLIVILVSILSEWLALLMPVYYLVTYKQLFGYGWWATLWRLPVIFFTGLSFATILAGFVEVVVRNSLILHKEFNGPGVVVLIAGLLVSLLPVAASYFIGKYRYQQRIKKLTQKPENYVRRNETASCPNPERD